MGVSEAFMSVLALSPPVVTVCVPAWLEERFAQAIVRLSSALGMYMTRGIDLERDG